MHTKILILMLSFGAPLLSIGQLDNLGKKLKNKAESKTAQRIDRKADKLIDKGLDEVEGKGEKKDVVAKDSETTSKSDSGPALQSYSKFDFIPGEKIIYAEDFGQDAIGELPARWNTSGKGEVVTLKDVEGKWLKLHQNATYLSANTKSFPKDFTLEFDLILQFTYKSYTLPLVSFGFLSSSTQKTTDNEFLTSPAKFSSALVELRPNKDDASFSFRSFVERKKYFEATDQRSDDFENNYNRTAHISMAAQESRLRIWVNSEKIFDMPNALSAQYAFNQLLFKIHSSGYKEDQIGFYISNLKVATGVPDTRHKLIDGGSFSTNGILFDLGSAVVKPQSYGIIKEIAAVLKEHSSVKIQIVGHTSSDGDDKQNIELSKKRALAVKDLLRSEYGIEDSRMQFEGKGESEPVADNKTIEGKLLNRRVAFIKL